MKVAIFCTVLAVLYIVGEAVCPESHENHENVGLAGNTESMNVHGNFHGSQVGPHQYKRSLGLHKKFNKRSLGLHNKFTKRSLGLHNKFTKRSLGLHKKFTKRSIDLSRHARSVAGLI